MKQKFTIKDRATGLVKSSGIADGLPEVGPDEILLVGVVEPVERVAAHDVEVAPDPVELMIALLESKGITITEADRSAAATVARARRSPTAEPPPKTEKGRPG